MAEITTIARPYAEALFRRAQETGMAAQWSEHLAWLTSLVENEQFAGVISDPRLTREQLVQFILGLSGTPLDSEAQNLLIILAENHRLGALPAIARQYEGLRHEHEGILDAQITSAYPLNEGQVQQLMSRLEKRLGKEVRVHVVVDSALLGGISITIGDRVIDGSVRARLEQMAVALKH
ncbi:F0F1 ATP synthase subunit delta [Ferrovum myxofaciens]|uniref:ATP synthase subunit delta n=1 Tax=Ferrovum myxofaciens TaxID=416213 RepID=A0A9E6SWU2_9PROT|nr:F0F1 ATP synthase subunit delta [Ferrovum myxofaciens]QKE38758.1 MAG: F0F1 ATP synthase subunit delta [Ferrovum myxofaciens]QWY73964.1 MAG: F0F1 ATP synthase subunit delta [Ferrovum myxofaciens]QWY76717.1 MAG: F0F1 ATP synthase subunit delta [Ferrovum myxofaciens]